MSRRSERWLALVLVPWLGACGPRTGEERTVTLATTHTIEDTGLLEVLTRSFSSTRPDIALRIVVVGSGEALALGRRGDADVLLTHAPEDEADFVEAGYGLDRRPIMRNEFVLYGPVADPANVRGMRDIAEAFGRIRARRSPFVSRGDDSGTHKRERAVWAALGLQPAGTWYLEAGVGQADALRIASERRAYILADRATYDVLAGALDIVPLSEGDPRLVNTYSVLRVAGAAQPDLATVVADWLESEPVRAIIRGLGTDAQGRPHFEPVTDSASPSASRPIPP
jgi:tungstate transport system substrate-binding protein